ncbi:MAG: hypothetical protein WCA91_01785 [Candidatus Acidiferrales bacterium]
MVHILWHFGVALQLVILARGLRAEMLIKYPFFYIYIFFTAAVSVFLYTLFLSSHSLFVRCYPLAATVTEAAGGARTTMEVTIGFEAGT